MMMMVAMVWPTAQSRGATQGRQISEGKGEEEELLLVGVVVDVDVVDVVVRIVASSLVLVKLRLCRFGNRSTMANSAQSARRIVAGAALAGEVVAIVAAAVVAAAAVSGSAPKVQQTFSSASSASPALGGCSWLR